MDKAEYSNISDQELLKRFYQDHNTEWLGVLLQRYTLLLLGLSMKYLKNEDDAKDNVQQVFLKVIQELQKYKVEYFKSWLYMVAKNHCLMRLRNKQFKNAVELTDKVFTTPTEELNKQELLDNDRTIDLMTEGLRELGEEQRQSVTLFYLQKKSYQEIATITGFSMLQVKSYIQNGKRNLKLWIDKKISEQAENNAGRY